MSFNVSSGSKEVKTIPARFKADKDGCGDLHILRFYSSYVAVRDGKVVDVTDPYMEYCPLAACFYKDIQNADSLEATKETIKKIINEKITKFGVFTGNRELFSENIAIPYGASEILMFAMRQGLIDASVVVCDGAGTVVVNRAEVVQGIGARMNGLFYTSPVGRTIERLKKAGCEVVFEDAAIDQIKGVEKAAELGYKNIAVTINALMDEDLKEIEKIENKFQILITVLTICTTGATKEKIREIEKYADIVWSCASDPVRKVVGKKAILQLSRKIPVFVLTQKGLDLVSGYSFSGQLIKRLDKRKQYILDSFKEGKRIEVGNFEGYLREETLPVRSKGEPRLLKNKTGYMGDH